MFTYFWERETERERERERERKRKRQNMSSVGAEREGDTESKAGSRLGAVSKESDAELKLMHYDITTWAEVRCLTDWATQAPLDFK